MNPSSSPAIQRNRSAFFPTLVATAALAFGISHSADAAEFIYSAVLNGTQEVPPNASPAIGGGQFTIDTDANTVTYRIVYNGLLGAESAAHFHGMAAPGANAGVLIALPAGNVKAGVWNYVEAQEANILAGLVYVNIHSAVFGGGEIRGQVVPLNAQLDGGQEVPPNGSGGAGWGVFTIDTVTNTLNYHIAFGGLAGAETAAHIHGIAMPGVNAGALFALPLGSPKIGAWVYPDAFEMAILEGRTYVNIHSAVFGGGEIRAQIVPMVVPIDNQQEVPPTGSPAAGLALVSYDGDNNLLGFDLRHQGLVAAESAAHIHGFAPPGANAGVLLALPLGARKQGVWAFGAANRANVLAGRTYFNIHSAAFGGGEIRGQIQRFPNPIPTNVPDVVRTTSIQLAPASPNPTTSQTRVQFALASEMQIRAAIYDASGRLVQSLADRSFAAGSHTVTWDGADATGRSVASGVYYYVLDTPEGRLSRGVTVLR